jgi:hypothetical protein
MRWMQSLTQTQEPEMNATLAKIDSFVRQPTTLVGLATMVGTATSLVTHQMPWAVALPLLAGALTAIVIPEKPAVQADVQQLVTDGIAAVVKPTASSGIAITADIVKLSHELAPGTQVVVVQPVPPVVAPTFQLVAPPVASVASTPTIAPAA